MSWARADSHPWWVSAWWMTVCFTLNASVRSIIECFASEVLKSKGYECLGGETFINLDLTLFDREIEFLCLLCLLYAYTDSVFLNVHGLRVGSRRHNSVASCPF